MAQVVVNGKVAGGPAPTVVVVLDHRYADQVADAEAFVEAMSGRKPSTWRDGTGTITVTASRIPAGGGG